MMTTLMQRNTGESMKYESFNDVSKLRNNIWRLERQIEDLTKFFNERMVDYAMVWHVPKRIATDHLNRILELQKEELARLHAEFAAL